MILWVSICYCDACQARATIERPRINARDAVWEGDACQARALIERRGTNARDAAIRRNDTILTPQ